MKAAGLSALLMVVAAIVLLAMALTSAPRGLFARPDAVQARPAEAVDPPERRWIPIDVPRDRSLGEFLVEQNLTGDRERQVFRRDCRDRGNLDLEQVANHHGRLWVAFGEPPPEEPPPCD